MLQMLNSKKVLISEMRDRADLQTLFGAQAVGEVLQFLNDTNAGKRLPGESDQDDSWVIERLDGGVEEDEMAIEMESNEEEGRGVTMAGK